jgi:hypothetical protein
MSFYATSFDASSYDLKAVGTRRAPADKPGRDEKQASRGGLPVVAAAVAAACCFCGSAAAGVRFTSSSCGHRGRSYAGVQADRVSDGVQATLASLVPPQVGDGLVAAWVGVGGVGEGKGGTNAWIQVGLAAFSDGVSSLYYEINQPRTGPQYTEVRFDVPANVLFRIEVLEIPSRPGWWRAWVNGAPVSPAVDLPGSSGRWRPVAAVEIWRNPGAACYRFAFSFERVATATSSRQWTPIAGQRFRDPGFGLRFTTPSTFVVSSSPSPT